MNRFHALSKHLTVLRESWREQNARDRSFRGSEHHAFLPAALEIIEEPPSPGLRWLLLLICSLFVAGLVWATFGRVDIVTVASGKVVSSGNVKIVQPIETGTIREIHVQNGQFVRAGQLLIELDPTLANAEEAQSAQSLQSAEIVKARNDALLSYLETGSARFRTPAGTTPSVVRTEQTFIQNSIAQYEAQRAGLVQQRAERQAEFAAAQARLANLKEALPFIDQQMEARKELAEKGFFSRLKLLEFEQARAEHVRNIEVQRANEDAARAAIGRLDADLANLRASFGKNTVSELSEASARATIAEQDLRKAQRITRYQRLRAPIDGVVQQLSVSTIGGVVQPAQPLLVVVPCTARRGAEQAKCNLGVTVDALVQNRDIGFVEVGQRVAVKLDAFDFTEYGLIEGTVASISRDAIARGEDDEQTGQGQPVYATRIELACGPAIPKPSSLCARVQPGMAAQVEIKTGSRRIIQYLLSPISRAMSEAGRER